jgi:lysozyme family protein
LIHPFDALKSEYTGLLVQMQITRVAEVAAAAERLLGFIDAGRYEAGCTATGVPQIVAAASFEREAGSNFRLNPAQGWPLSSRSRDVPYNGPFADWTTAQIAAYQIDGLDKVGAANWSWELGCYEEEGFNGWGYRAHGVPSPYLFGGSNIQRPGKYDADSKYNKNEMDTQLGVIPMMLRIVQMRPALALPFPFPAATTSAVVVPVPMPPPQGLHDAASLQTLLNALGADPQLIVDGNFGRNTKRAVQAFQAANGLAVDGLAGPQTWSLLNAKLAA